MLVDGGKREFGFVFAGVYRSCRGWCRLRGRRDRWALRAGLRRGKHYDLIKGLELVTRWLRPAVYFGSAQRWRESLVIFWQRWRKGVPAADLGRREVSVMYALGVWSKHLNHPFPFIFVFAYALATH
jgi:hypothetical protein